MADRYQIEMDFSKAKQKAGELENVADRLQKISGTDLLNVLNGLGNDWKGENADLYIRKGFLLKENMERTVGSIRATASSIRTVAQNIYNAEMEALRIAEESAAELRRLKEAEERAKKAQESSKGRF